MAKRSSKSAPRPKVLARPDDPRRAMPAEVPVSLDEIAGQQAAKHNIRSAIVSGRVHHAWIFHGPPGVGKFTTALAFAAVILDPSTAPDLAGELRPDPDSEVQALLRAGTHPDLHVVRKELARFSEDRQTRERKLLTIPKEVVEQHLLEPAQRAANMPGWLARKVFIVDEAELLDRSPTNAPVQNALLKTLEEPAPGTVIILVTSNEERLLPTIRSRSQRVGFAPLNEAEMRAWIRARGIEIPPGEEEWAMRYAQGSPGRLLEAVETGVLGWRRLIEPRIRARIEGRYDPLLGPTLAGLADEWAGEHVKRGEAVGENRSKEAANREAAARVLAVVAEMARDALRQPHLAESAAALIDAVLVAERRLAANVQMPFVFEELAAPPLPPAPAGFRR